MTGERKTVIDQTDGIVAIDVLEQVERLTGDFAEEGSQNRSTNKFRRRVVAVCISIVLVLTLVLEVYRTFGNRQFHEGNERRNNTGF